MLEQNLITVSFVARGTPITKQKNKEFMTELEIGTTDELEQRIKNTLGLRDYDHFKQFKIDAATGMQDHGDVFTKALGLALTYSSDDDAIKIMRVWPGLVTQYEMIHRFAEAKKRALDELQYKTL